MWLETLNSQIPVNLLLVSPGEKQVKELDMTDITKCLGQVLVSDLRATRKPETLLALSLGK